MVLKFDRFFEKILTNKINEGKLILPPNCHVVLFLQNRLHFSDGKYSVTEAKWEITKKILKAIFVLFLHYPIILMFWKRSQELQNCQLEELDCKYIWNWHIKNFYMSKNEQSERSMYETHQKLRFFKPVSMSKKCKMTNV